MNKTRKLNWKKLIVWGVAGLIVLIIAIAITGILLLQHSQSFRHSLLMKVEKSIADSTGAQVSVRDFNLHMSTLTLDLYDIVVRGTETNPDQPLLKADHLGVGLKILSFVHRKWRLQDVTLNHPVVHVLLAGRNP